MGRAVLLSIRLLLEPISSVAEFVLYLMYGELWIQKQNIILVYPTMRW